MKHLLRLESPRDYLQTEHLTYRAFSRLQAPGREICDEHLLVHKMRRSPSFVRELDYVAEADGELIGNIMYTKSRIVSADGAEHETLTFGPVSVLPGHQKKGLGAALIHHTIAEAKKLGYRAILIFGHPEYYPRFGFKNAKEYGITTAEGENFDAFMALELYDGALTGIGGKFYYDPVFEIDKDELRVFNESFFSKLEIFFDYACPYCLHAHKHLIELLPSYPEIKVVWRPCESHPRPDRYGPHSDLCIQGMFYALEHDADIFAYHDAVYRATLRERINVEDINTLADCVRDIVDADAVRESLRSGEYAGAQQEANRYAFGESGVWVVPAYRMNGKKLDAVEDVGITKEMLRNFIESAIQ